MLFIERLYDALMKTPEQELRMHPIARALGDYVANSTPRQALCEMLAKKHANDNRVPQVCQLIHKYGIIPMQWEYTN